MALAGMVPPLEPKEGQKWPEIMGYESVQGSNRSNFWCEHHSLVAQTMLKICPNLSVIVEILITRLMSRWRRDITVDRGVSPV